MLIYQILMVVLLLLGFGFVIFWHELGHFLAARWAGVRVEQFAVGMGHAICSFRRGQGFKFGTSRPEYDKMTAEQLVKDQISPKGADGEYTEYQRELAAKKLGLGETEYRLSWIPLGGYVKPTGQDDLRPSHDVNRDDPRAYNAVSVGKRMVIISAGVIMNVILAAILFMVLFLVGYRSMPAIVGQVSPGSPAQVAGLRTGDRVLYFDGAYQHDFTKIRLNTALARDNIPVPLEVERLDGSREKLTVVPTRGDNDPHSLMQVGIYPPFALKGAKEEDYLPEEMQTTELYTPDALAIKPGDVVTAVNGQPILNDTPEARRAALNTFDNVLQASNGEPITLTLRNASGATRPVQLHPQFALPFRDLSLSFVGMQPRVKIGSVQYNSTARKKIFPDDVVVRFVNTEARVDELPSVERFRNLLFSAGERGESIDITVMRDGKVLPTIKGLLPNIPLQNGGRGLGVGPGADEDAAVIASIDTSSPAAVAGIPAGATVLSVAGQPVKSWHDVWKILSSSASEIKIPVVARSAPVAALPSPATATAATAPAAESVASEPEEKTYELTLSARDLEKLQSYRYTVDAIFSELIEPRKTSNPITAAGWGMVETRDFILQFYVTLQRMISGDVSYKNMSGPVGIIAGGSRIAFKGGDWLLWFLAMISANLAVVNFLPIPILDGGQFVFLILEKITGKPLSPKAQAIAQYVGLAIILSVFILATYQDITRFF